MTVLAAAALLTVGGAAAAHSAGLIGSAGIKNDSVRSIDIHNGTIRGKDLRPGLRALINQPGPMGPRGPKGDSGTATYAGPNWSTIDRNTIGGAVAILRAGPSSMGSAGAVTPKYGVGSLGFNVSDSNSAVSWGDQVDFSGNPLSSITAPGFSVYTVGDNPSPTTNLPNLKFEVFVNGGNSGYSTLVYVPPTISTADFSTWKTFDASTGAQWYFTGSQGTATGCNQTTYCDWAGIQSAAPNATLISVGVGKGRDYAWNGAVDGLRLNPGTVYDFEPFGVSQVAEK